MSNGKVAVIGLGYVGLPLALLMKEKNLDIIGVDLDKSKVDTINSGKSPIEDEFIDNWVKQVSLHATTDINEAADADIFVVCVPTPVINHVEPDLGPVKGATESIAKVMKKGALVIIESTINPGVCEDVVDPIIKRVSGYSDDEFYLAHCPERINPGDPKWSVRNINRVVGGKNSESLRRAVALYESIIEADIKPMNSLKEAEAVKVVENSFRDINIAFVNELAMSFQRMGINIENIIDGAATKPFAFMPHRPGCGVGGHCIPVDPYYLIEYARGFGFEHEFLSLARKINSQMPQFTVELLQDALNDHSMPIKGTKVALLGLAYKPNVDDDRESPAHDIKQYLEEAGADVVAYDPHIPSKSTVHTLDEALDQADAVLIATSHNQFKSIDANKLKQHNIPILIDGRNLLKDQKDNLEQAGIRYVGIGIQNTAPTA